MCEEDSSKQSFVGELNQQSFDFEIITWKISNVSSISFLVDYGVESPPFTIAGASWILKIYFDGQTHSNSKGYIDVSVERLHSEIEKHNSSWKVYCKNTFGREFQPVTKKFSFYANHTKMDIHKFMENFQGRVDEWELASNDTFTLVYEVQNQKSSVVTKSVDQAAAIRSTEKPVGEIQQTSYESEIINWTICNVSYLPSPALYQVQSSPFSFASASWTLKIYPYFRLAQANKQYFYIALKRLYSQISEHYVSASISFENRISKKSEELSRSYIFDSDHTQGDPVCFSLQKEQIIAPNDIFTFICKFKTKKKSEIELEFLTKLTESIEGNTRKLRPPACPHHNQILQDLKLLYMKQEDCDAIIRVQGKEFPAHRVILQARSPVFNSAFNNDMKEKTTGVIDIEDCDPATFSDFLCFLYCGEIEKLSASNVFSLFTTADKYSVLDLRLKCMEFLKENLTVDTFCDTITLALKHSEDELVKISTDFFAKNIQKIIVTVKWQSFITENPISANELMIKALIPNNSRM